MLIKIYEEFLKDHFSSQILLSPRLKKCRHKSSTRAAQEYKFRKCHVFIHSQNMYKYVKNGNVCKFHVEYSQYKRTFQTVLTELILKVLESVAETPTIFLEKPFVSINS